MTDNTQELDDILFDLCDLSYASFTTQEEADRVADQLDYDRAKAKQALIDWHNKQVLEIIGNDQSQKRPEGGKNTAEWTNGRNNLRQQQRNKLKEMIHG